MIFTHSRRGVLKIGPDALATMRSFEQRAPDALEAGGVLLGRYLRGGFDLAVDSVTVPKPGDERSRFGFYFHAPAHQPEIDRAWRESEGTCVVLGNWHTHAEPFPTPSPIDLDDWNRRLRADVREDEACFFVIVGQREIRVWEGDRRTGRISRLSARAEVTC